MNRAFERIKVKSLTSHSQRKSLVVIVAATVAFSHVGYLWALGSRAYVLGNHRLGSASHSRSKSCMHGFLLADAANHR